MAKVKICGLKRPEDIEMVNALAPDYCGFIINFPKSHRSRTPEQVRELVKRLDRSRVTPVGVFVDSPVEDVAALLLDGSIDLAQLHGHEDEDYISRLKAMTGKPVIKAFKVTNGESLARAAASPADHILLDQGQGSGETFDWSVFKSPEAREIFGESGTPEGEWFLAGGLSEANIGQAIKAFAPFAVDLSSAVETDQYKDYDKVRRIIEIVRRT